MMAGMDDEQQLLAQVVSRLTTSSSPARVIVFGSVATGWTVAVSLPGAQIREVPARVEMDRTAVRDAIMHYRGPRARGDGPVARLVAPWSMSEVPARVEMDRCPSPTRHARLRGPHARDQTHVLIQCWRELAAHLVKVSGRHPAGDRGRGPAQWAVPSAG